MRPAPETERWALGPQADMPKTCSGWMSDLKGSVSVTDNSSTAVANIDRKLTDWIKMHRPISGELKPFDCPQLHRTKLDRVDGTPSWVENRIGRPGDHHQGVHPDQHHGSGQHQLPRPRLCGLANGSNGNDGVLLSKANGHFCGLDVTVDQAFPNGANGAGVPIMGSTCIRVLPLYRPSMC